MSHRIFKTAFAGIYPHYVAKVEKKGRTKAELDEVICWLTGHTARSLADVIESDRVWVSKHALTTIHGCEAHHVAGRGEFEWSAANARGIVAHRAIEVMVNYRGDPHPPDLVDEAIARYEADEDSSIGRYLTSLAEFDRADLRGQAVNLVARFRVVASQDSRQLCAVVHRGGRRMVVEAMVRRFVA